MTTRDRLIELVRKFELSRHAEISEHFFWTNSGLYLRTIYRIWPIGWNVESVRDLIGILGSFGQSLRFDPATGAFIMEEEEKIDDPA